MPVYWTGAYRVDYLVEKRRTEFVEVKFFVWLHCSNDVYDSDTGADKNKKESVVSITGRYCTLVS